MADTTRSVGTAGTMIIRDNGSTIQFIIQCTDPATNVGQYNWSGTVNGSSVGGTVSLPAGFGYRVLGTWTVTTNQTVTFNQAATGTSGLGGAASLSASVNRSTTPGQPGKPSASAIGPNTQTLSWTIPSNGGAAIDQMLLRVNTKSPADSSGYFDIPNAGNVTSRQVNDMAPGQKFYWVVYAHNANGYGPKSAELFSPTLPVAPGAPVVSSITKDAIKSAWSDTGNGDAVTGYDLQYATNSSFSSATTIATTAQTYTLSNLKSGERYYLRVRAKTASGAGAWSSVTQAVTTLPAVTLVINTVQPTSVYANWTASEGTSDFDLQYATNSSFSGATTLSVTGLFRTITGLTAKTAYWFRVRPKTADATAAWSNVVTATTLPDGAPGITVSPSASGQSATVSLTSPGGATGVTKYTVERRIGTGTATSTDTTSNTLSVSGLTPGTSYQWRASAWFGTYQSPFSNWITVFQPNPNTNPGDYFDGSTAARDDLTFSWTGTASNSTSLANGFNVNGWDAGVPAGGGAVRLQRVSGGRNNSYAARMNVIADATGPGKVLGMTSSGSAGSKRAAVQADALYVGSIYVKPSRSQRLYAEILWFDAAGAEVTPRGAGDEVVVTSTTSWTRLIASGTAPAGAVTAAVRARDVSGTGFSPWLSGEWLDADSAMITLASLFDWFSGGTTDTLSYDYQWLGTPNASVSARYERTVAPTDPLADPDCPPLPTPPALPTIAVDCIDEVGVWRRYTLLIPATEVRQWASTLPTLVLSTQANAERQVRIRYYSNPSNLDPELVTEDEWEAEQILTYIPPNTEITLDGVTQRVSASVNGAASIPANRLLYGTGGVPATWPELSCGIGYVVTMDVPLEAPAGNLDARVVVTQRM